MTTNVTPPPSHKLIQLISNSASLFGTLIWTLTFITCLPDTAASVKAHAAKNLLLQMAPPFLRTVMNLIEVTWWGFEYILIAMYRYLKKPNLH